MFKLMGKKIFTILRSTLLFIKPKKDTTTNLRAPCICTLFAISDDIFCALFVKFNCALFSHPNQDQLVINGRVTMTCTGNLICNACAMKLLNAVQSFFFKCTLYMDSAMDII